MLNYFQLKPHYAFSIKNKAFLRVFLRRHFAVSQRNGDILQGVVSVVEDESGVVTLARIEQLEV